MSRGGSEPERSRALLERVLWIGVALAFAPALVALAREWLSFDAYTHGFLVPLVSAAAAHPIVRRLGPPRRSLAGLVGVAAALALYALGLALDSAAVQGLALVGTLCGLVAFRWGVPGLRRLAFPLGFLLFMIPIPQTWLLPIVVGLQLVVTGAAVEALHAFAVPVLREGNVMLLPGGATLFVDEACSGITSIVTLFPLGVLLAYLTERSVWRRAAILAVVVPAALLGNFLRVVVTVWIARVAGAERATSAAIHESAGLLTFVFACLLVVGTGALLRQRPGPRSGSASA